MMNRPVVLAGIAAMFPLGVLLGRWASGTYGRNPKQDVAITVFCMAAAVLVAWLTYRHHATLLLRAKSAAEARESR